MVEIDVEKIMAEIRQEIKDKGYTPDMLSFKDINAPSIIVKEFNADELMCTVSAIEATKYIPWEREIADGGLKGFIKKVVRKLIGFIIAPVSADQNVYNQHISEAFMQLLSFVEKQNKQIEEYDELIASLEKRLEKAEN